MLASIARHCYRRRRFVILGWIGLVILLQVLGGALGVEASTDFNLPGSESRDAQKTLEQGGFGGRSGISGDVVVKADQGVDDPQVKQFVQRYLAAIAAERPSLEIVSPYAPEGAP